MTDRLPCDIEREPGNAAYAARHGNSPKLNTARPTALVVMWRGEDAAFAFRVSDGKGPEAARFRRKYGKANCRLVDIEEARRLMGNYIDLKSAGKAP